MSPPQGTRSPGVPPDATETLPAEGGRETGTPGSPFLTLLPNSPILQTERLRAREGERPVSSHEQLVPRRAPSPCPAGRQPSQPTGFPPCMDDSDLQAAAQPGWSGGGRAAVPCTMGEEGAIIFLRPQPWNPGRPSPGHPRLQSKPPCPGVVRGTSASPASTSGSGILAKS